MNAPVRTVHLLERGLGQPKETRTVRGITIESGVPVPPSNRLSALTEALIAMQMGDCIVWSTPATNHRSYVLRHYKERRYKAHRFGEKYRIWRTK